MSELDSVSSKPIVNFVDNPVDPIFIENQIDYHNPLTPIEIARNKAEKASKEKKLVCKLYHIDLYS